MDLLPLKKELKKELRSWQTVLLLSLFFSFALTLIFLNVDYRKHLEKWTERQTKIDLLTKAALLFNSSMIAQHHPSALTSTDNKYKYQKEVYLIDKRLQVSHLGSNISPLKAALKNQIDFLNKAKPSISIAAQNHPALYPDAGKIIAQDAEIRSAFFNLILHETIKSRELKLLLDKRVNKILLLLGAIVIVLGLIILRLLVKVRNYLALRSRDAKTLHNLTTSTQEGFIILSDKLQVILINAKAQKYFQAYTGEWLEKGDCLPNKLSRTSDAVLRKGMEVVKSGNIFRQERRVIMDGMERIGEYEFRPLWDAQNTKLTGVNVLVRDITELKQYEQERADLLERLHLVNGLVQLGNWHYNPHTGEIKLDEVSARMLELPPDHATDAAEFRSMVYHEDSAYVTNTIQLLGTKANEVEMSYRIVTPEGNLKYIYQKAICRFDTNGNVQDIIGGMVDITQHKKAELRFRQVFDTSPNALILVDRTGSIVMANKEAFLLCGYTEEELNGMAIRDLFVHGAAQRVSALMRATKKQMFVFNDDDSQELFIQTKDKQLKSVELRLNPMEQDGEPMILTSITDVSARKAADAERKELLSRFEMAASATQLGIWDYDVQKQALIWNGYMYQLFGVEYNTPVTLGLWRSLIDPADLTAVVKQFDALLAQYKKEWHTTYRIRPYGNNGGEKILEQHVISFFDDKGRVIRCLGTALDVTKTKQDEAKHQELIKRFDLAANTVHLGILDVDLYKGTVRGDSRLMEMLQVDLTECNQLEAWINKIHPGDYLRLQQELQHALRRKTMMSTEWRQLRKDGTTKFYETKVKFLWDEGQPHRAIAATIDITDKVVQRLELEAAKKRAEQSEALQEQFLANMSHEIRTPLNGILGIADLMGRSELTSQQRQNLNIIQNSSQSLLTIINDVLDISKIKAGKLNIEQELFHLHAVVQNAFELLQFKASQKGLAYNIHLAADVPQHLQGDPSRLSQILINLLANAVKFTRVGSVSLAVDVAYQTEKNIAIRFVVTDTGIGIVPDAIGNIFDNFSQAGTSIGVEFGGTGLGLTISKKLVELQNGSIEVVSEPGIGSAFTVTIPYLKAHQANKNFTDPVSTSTWEYTGNKKILVAEDNEVNRIVINEYLQQAGFDATIVNDGQQAVDEISKNNFDLVILDLRMPYLNGFEVAGVIRNELNLNVPILALTASTLRSEKEYCLTIGMNAYLAKPFKPAALFDIIHNLLGGKKPTEDQSESSEPIAEEASVEKVVDMNTLRNLGDKTLVLHVLEQFKTNGSKTLTDMASAVQQNDVKSIHELSHRLKGSAGMLGLVQFESRLRKMEHISSIINTDHSLTANLFDHLVKDFEVLKESLPTVTAEVQNW